METFTVVFWENEQEWWFPLRFNEQCLEPMICVPPVESTCTTAQVDDAYASIQNS